MKTLSKYKEKSLKNPEFEKEYNALDLQYKVIHELISCRLKTILVKAFSVVVCTYAVIALVGNIIVLFR